MTVLGHLDIRVVRVPKPILLKKKNYSFFKIIYADIGFHAMECKPLPLYNGFYFAFKRCFSSQIVDLGISQKILFTQA